MLGICAITLFASIMFYTVQTQSGLALNALGVRNPAKIAELTMLASLGVPLGTVVFRSLSRHSVAVLLLIEFMLIGLGFLGMSRAFAPPQFALASLLNQVGCGMALPTLLTWATRGLAFEVRGRGTGIWTATFSVGQFLSGVLVTLLADNLGGLPAAFGALAICNGVAGLVAVSRHLLVRSTAAIRV